MTSPKPIDNKFRNEYCRESMSALLDISPLFERYKKDKNKLTCCATNTKPSPPISSPPVMENTPGRYLSKYLLCTSTSSSAPVSENHRYLESFIIADDNA